MGLVKSLVSEYGLLWTINRMLYSLKLKMLNLVPSTEKLFEKKVTVKRIDIFDFDIEKLKTFLLKLPNEKKNEIVKVADKAIRGVILGFSSIELDYGNPMNWHLNPLTGGQYSKEIKWYRIPDFDKKNGDIKVVWEASRFTHFFAFTRAYLLTGEDKYYKAFSSQLEDWLKSNPYSYGANFKCGQECALRMINTLMTYEVFYIAGVATDKDTENVKELVKRCYKKVLANFFYSYRCVKNNHTISELCGMIIGAWCNEDSKIIARAYKQLNKVICEQFTVDGGYCQFSFNYQRLALQGIECVLNISGKTGYSLADGATERIRNSALLLYQCQTNDGSLPNYGPNDGALIFPITSCSYRDYRPVINTVYARITGRRLYENGIYDEELLWFSGSVECETEHIKRQSFSFEDAGIFTLRHDNGFLMIVLNDYKTRPAHMDQLHIDVWHKGMNILCDSGTYSYASNLGRELISTSGHNTAAVDKTDQMNQRGNFMIYDWTKRHTWKHDNNGFEGSMISHNRYLHSRNIIKTNDGYEIIDIVNARNKKWAVLFRTPCDVAIDSGSVKLFYDGTEIAQIKSNAKIELTKSKQSLYYLQANEIHCLRFLADTNIKVVKTVIKLIH